MTSHRVLHLVLYSPNKYYTAMYYASREYYARWIDRNVRTIYYTYCPEQTEPFVYDESEHMLRIRDGQEQCIPCSIQHNPGVFEKTVLACEWAHTHFAYDYLIRSNISSLVNFAALLPRLHTVTGYGGCTLNFAEAGGIFVRGTSIILTRTLVEHVLALKHHLDLNMVDDVGLAKFIREHVPEAYPPVCMNRFSGAVCDLKGDFERLRSILTPELRQTCAFFRFKAQEFDMIFDRNVHPCRMVDVMQLTFVAEWLKNDY